MKCNKTFSRISKCARNHYYKYHKGEDFHFMRIGGEFKYGEN